MKPKVLILATANKSTQDNWEAISCAVRDYFSPNFSAKLVPGRLKRTWNVSFDGGATVARRWEVRLSGKKYVFLDTENDATNEAVMAAALDKLFNNSQL